MDLSISEEQDALQRSVRALCDDRFPTSAVRACEQNPAAASAIYDDLFAMGLGGILIDENAGGLSLGLTEMVVTQMELGRALVPMLFAESTVLTSGILAHSNDAAVRALLPQLASGEKRASCAWQEQGRPLPNSAQATQLSDGGTLDGTKVLVADADMVDYLIVLASDTAGQNAWCLVARDAAGIERVDLPNMADLSMANVTFVQTPVLATIARGDAATAAWEQAQTAMKIAIAAQAVGGAEKALEITRDYACTRQQFGQPIGAFQSIAHYLADAAVNVEGARMLVYRAAAAADHGEPAETWADLAKMKACQVYRDVSALAIQIHGGIGFTLEADPQLYYRRAKHLQLMYGDPLDLQERAGEALISGTHKVLEA